VLLAPLAPLAQQWDRLSSTWCWMLILRGPTKVDLIFPEEAHTDEPPWQPSVGNLAAIDAHFWDWTLWLRGKEAGGKADLLDAELDKLFLHLLAPLGVSARPRTLVEAIAEYHGARERAERALGVEVPRDLEAAVASAFDLRGG
jgi:hypothetical protein